MSLAQALPDVEYPESDGKPMGETDLHRGWMNRVFELLRRHYRGQRVYVSCNLFVYYAEGDPFESCVPDVFVVRDCDPKSRRIFKTWEEDRSPEVVFEITSRSTRRDDEVFKPQSYAKMGVIEYFLYDPTAEYLKPALMGYRLTKSGRRRIRPDVHGKFTSHELGLKLWLEGRELVLADTETGQRLLTDTEAAEAKAAAEAATAESEAARAAAEAARADRFALQARDEANRANAAEEEVRRLQAELARLRKRS
jgi:Uma2 family endonuclease